MALLILCTSNFLVSIDILRLELPEMYRKCNTKLWILGFPHTCIFPRDQIGLNIMKQCEIKYNFLEKRLRGKFLLILISILHLQSQYPASAIDIVIIPFASWYERNTYIASIEINSTR